MFSHQKARLACRSDEEESKRYEHSNSPLEQLRSQDSSLNFYLDVTVPVESKRCALECAHRSFWELSGMFLGKFVSQNETFRRSRNFLRKFRIPGRSPGARNHEKRSFSESFVVDHDLSPPRRCRHVFTTKTQSPPPSSPTMNHLIPDSYGEEDDEVQYLFTRPRHLPTQQVILTATTTPTGDERPRGRGRPPQAVLSFSANTGDPFYHESNSVQFIIRGRPVPKARPTGGNNSNVYNPTAAKEREFAAVTMNLMSHHIGKVFVFGQNQTLKIKCVFGYPFPLGNDEANIIDYSNVADVDNLGKFVLDSFNTVLYHDDRQVEMLTLRKTFDNQYGGEGYIQVSICAMIAV